MNNKTNINTINIIRNKSNIITIIAFDEYCNNKYKIIKFINK